MHSVDGAADLSAFNKGLSSHRKSAFGDYARQTQTSGGVYTKAFVNDILKVGDVLQAFIRRYIVLVGVNIGCAESVV